MSLGEVGVPGGVGRVSIAFTRGEAQGAGALLHATELPGHMTGWSEQQTSGSTGIPLRHRRSALVEVTPAAS